MPYDRKVFEQFERLSPQEQQARIQSLDPNQLDQFENDYQQYQLESGANRYQRVARGGLAETTQTTKPSNSQILQSTGKEAAKAVGQEAVKEGLKQGAKKVVGKGIASNLSQLGAGPTAGIVAGTYLAGKSAYDLLKGNPDDKSASGKFGRGQLAVSTGGLSEVGRLFGIGGHKSTDQHSAEKWGQSASLAKTDLDKQAVNDFYNKRIEDNKKNPDSIFGEGALVGRKYKWDEVSKVAKGADIAGEHAFFQGFPDWMSGYSEGERNAIAEAAIDNGLISSDKGDLVFNTKNGNLDRIKGIAQQIKEGTYTPLKTDEQRWADKQAFLQNLKDTEGYISPELGEPYIPPEVRETEDRSNSEDNNTEATATKYIPKPRPKPKLNDIPAPVPQPVPKPEIRTPKDYAQAYLDVYNANSQLSGVNPYLRRY